MMDHPIEHLFYFGAAFALAYCLLLMVSERGRSL